MVAVGDTTVWRHANRRSGVTCWIEFEVTAVVEDRPGVFRDTARIPLRWAIMDGRSQASKEARPNPVVNFPTPRANQLTTDPANIDWQSLNSPQQAAYSDETAFNILFHPDDVAA